MVQYLCILTSAKKIEYLKPIYTFSNILELCSVKMLFLDALLIKYIHTVKIRNPICDSHSRISDSLIPNVFADSIVSLGRIYIWTRVYFFLRTFVSIDMNKTFLGRWILLEKTKKLLKILVFFIKLLSNNEKESLVDII